MLVLNRKTNERIIIDGNIVVEVRRITPTRVALAIDAPEHIKILRSEVQRPQEPPAAA